MVEKFKTLTEEGIMVEGQDSSLYIFVGKDEVELVVGSPIGEGTTIKLDRKTWDTLAGTSLQMAKGGQGA